MCLIIWPSNLLMEILRVLAWTMTGALRGCVSGKNALNNGRNFGAFVIVRVSGISDDF